MSPELHAAIENLYSAFGDVPKPAVIEGCPCCIERKGVDVLLRKPLREITPDELSNSQGLNKGRLTNSFWDADMPAYRQILAWFDSPEIKRIIRESYGL